jgi:predicted SAM-dependent methyltransferase
LVNENLSEKVDFVCTSSSRTDFYPQQVSLVGINHWWDVLQIFFMWIGEYLQGNLLPIGREPSYREE